jgi:heat shock protein HslJ
MRRLSPPLCLLLALAIAVVGCGAEDEPGVGTGQPDSLPVGRSFDATGASEGGRERPLVAKAGIEFGAGGATSVVTGCNGAGGTARMRDGRLVSDGFSITNMACVDPGVMEQETFVMSVVEGGPEVLLDGDVLVLRTAAAEIRFLDRRVSDPDRPLEGTRWRVTGEFDQQTASASAALSAELVLSGGRLRFTATCQDAEGPATVQGTTVEVGKLEVVRTQPLIAATSSTAASPPGARSAPTCSADQQQAETSVLRLLTGTLEAKVNRANLMLTRPDGAGITLTEAR